MKGLAVFCFTILALIVAFTGSASANVDFWLTQAGDTTPITSGSTIIVDAGDPVNMSVWYTTDDDAGILNFMLGYASSTTWGDSATPLSSPLLAPEYVESMWSSGSSYWPTSNFASGFTTTYPMLGGGYHPTSGAVRPWGLFQGGYFASDDALSNQRVFDFEFSSLMDYGESVTLTIWDASTAGDIGDQDIWTTNLMNMDLMVYRPGENYSITLQVVPEPSTLLILATGLSGMVGMVLRKRRK